ncbi:MAG: hypothetical protein EP319_10620 [Deltaproteobacteria bacterium]|nr:MAG: hypothetical protein EP319_10620 [Deltaproteobacteria bacterium]
MLHEQKLVLEEYMRLLGNPTFREMAADSGIQLTRLFRIMNGMEMRLKEYLILKKRVEELESSNDLQTLAFKCKASLSGRARKELEELMKRFLKQQQLMAA